MTRSRPADDASAKVSTKRYALLQNRFDRDILEPVREGDRFASDVAAVGV